MYLRAGYVECSSCFVSAGIGQVQVLILQGKDEHGYSNNDTSPHNLPREKKKHFHMKDIFTVRRAPLWGRLMCVFRIHLGPGKSAGEVWSNGCALRMEEHGLSSWKV